MGRRWGSLGRRSSVVVKTALYESGTRRMAHRWTSLGGSMSCRQPFLKVTRARADGCCCHMIAFVRSHRELMDWS